MSKNEIFKLSIPQRIILAEEIWDSIASDAKGYVGNEERGYVNSSMK